MTLITIRYLTLTILNILTIILLLTNFIIVLNARETSVKNDRFF